MATLADLLNDPLFTEAYQARRERIVPPSPAASTVAAPPSSGEISAQEFVARNVPSAPTPDAGRLTEAPAIVRMAGAETQESPWFAEDFLGGSDWLSGTGSRLAVGSLDNPAARLAALEAQYGRGNVMPIEGDNFIINEGGIQREYNPRGFDIGDIVSVAPEIVGTVGGVLGEIGGAIGGAAATPFTAGVINPLTGAVAGGAAGYTGAKQGTKALISSLYDLPESDVGEGLATDIALGAIGPAIGPAARLAYRGAIKPAAGAVLDVVDPFRMASQARTGSVAAQNIEELIPGITPSAPLTAIDRNALIASGLGLSPESQVAADLITDFGALNTSARMGEANRLRALGAATRYGTAVEDLLKGRVGVEGTVDPLGAGINLGDVAVTANEALRAGRSALYSGIDPTRAANLAGIQRAIAARTARATDPTAAVAEAPLAQAMYDLATQATRRGPAGTVYRTAPEAAPTGIVTQADLDQLAMRNFARQETADVPVGDIINLYRQPGVGFAGGLRGPALDLQQGVRAAVQRAIPELAAADVAARPYSKLTTLQKRFLSEDAQGNVIPRDRNLIEPFTNALQKGNVNMNTVEHLTDLFDAGLIKGADMVDMADQLLASVPADKFAKLPTNVANSLLSISSMRSTPELIGRVYNAAGQPIVGGGKVSAKTWLAKQQAPGSVVRTQADIAGPTLRAGTRAGEAATAEANRRILEGNIARAAAQRNLAYNPIRAASSSAANDVLTQYGLAGLAGAFAHPLAGAGMLWSSRGLPFLRSQALTKSTRAKEALLRRSAERAMRSEAATRAGTALPGILRELSPGYRTALRDVSAERAADVAAIDAARAAAGMQASGLATPQLESIFSNLRKPISDPSELIARGAFSAWRNNQ